MDRAAVFGAVLLVLLGPGLARAEDGYRRLVEAYADGDRYAAARELGGREPGSLVDEVAALVRELRESVAPRRRAQLLRAGALLHTEQAVLRQREGDDEAAHRHTELAWSYVRLVDVLPQPTAALLSFSQRFYLLQGLLGQAVRDAKKARSFLEEGLKRFPRSATLLLALGSLEEATARFDDLRAHTPPLPRPDGIQIPGGPRRHERLVFLGRAEALYRRALEVAPELDEARLRLGRVLQAERRLPEAYASLTLVTRTSDPDLLYLAHLFLGRLHEETHKLEPAVQEYRAAVAASPLSATGYLALSRSLDEIGDRTSARESLDLALSHGRTDPRTLDPWCTYPYGQARDAQGVFDRMVLEPEP